MVVEFTIRHYYCVCPKPGSAFPTPYVLVFFVFNGLRSEVNARFLDIGGIVDHHCLNFLFMNMKWCQRIVYKLSFHIHVVVLKGKLTIEKVKKPSPL